MMSLQISLTPHRLAAARFVSEARSAIKKMYVDAKRETGLTQSKIAETLGVHRSAINRQINGEENMTLGRIGELACLMGYEAHLSFRKFAADEGQNIPAQQRPKMEIQKYKSSSEDTITINEIYTERLPKPEYRVA